MRLGCNCDRSISGTRFQCGIRTSLGLIHIYWFGYCWTIVSRTQIWKPGRWSYRGKQTRKNTTTLAADVIRFSSVFWLSEKRKTDTRNMLSCAILFCTFPEIQGVGYRKKKIKNPVRDGRSKFSFWGLEKPLGGMEGKRQGLSCFLSFFSLLFSPSFEKKKKKRLRSGCWIFLGVSPCFLQKQQDSGHTCVFWDFCHRDKGSRKTVCHISVIHLYVVRFLSFTSLVSQRNIFLKCWNQYPSSNVNYFLNYIQNKYRFSSFTEKSW